MFKLFQKITINNKNYIITKKFSKMSGETEYYIVEDNGSWIKESKLSELATSEKQDG